MIDQHPCSWASSYACSVVSTGGVTANGELQENGGCQPEQLDVQALISKASKPVVKTTAYVTPLSTIQTYRRSPHLHVQSLSTLCIWMEEMATAWQMLCEWLVSVGLIGKMGAILLQ